MRRYDHTFVLAAVIGIVGGTAPWGCSDPEPPPSARETTPAVQATAQPAESANASTKQATFETPQLEPRPVTFADAETAYRDQRYAEAVDLFAAYTAQKPQNAWGHYMLGLAAWKAGQSGKAETAFETAIQLDPRHVKSLLNWSRVLLDSGRNEDAVAKLEAALDIDPTSSDACRLLGRAHDAMGHRSAAIDAYRLALVLDARDAWSMNNMGLIWIREGRCAEALPPLARAVELRADVAVFQNNLGVALERLGHAAAAAAAYREVLSLDANYEKAALSLARVEALSQSTAAETLDLAAVARGFDAEVRGWRDSMPSQARTSAGDSSSTTKALAARDQRPMTPEDDD